MSWYSKVGIKWGKPKDLYGGRGFQKNSVMYWGGAYVGALYSGYNSVAGTSYKAGTGTSNAVEARNAANTNANGYTAVGTDRRNNSIAEGTALASDVGIGKDPYAKSAMDEAPVGSDPNIVADGAAAQAAALARQRRQRMITSLAGQRSDILSPLGRTTRGAGQAKTLLGS